MSTTHQQTIDVEKVIREYLPTIIHMSLATVYENRPWVCEVHSAYDEDLNLYFRSKSSRRHSQEIEQNPHVAGNIVRQHALEDAPVGLYFEGTSKQITADEDCDAAATLINARFDLGDEIINEAKKEDGHKFYKVTVENWYAFGRFGAEHSQKHKLVR